MTEQNTNWVEQEIAELETQTETVFEKLPALKFIENKITEVTIDCANKWNSYETTDQKQQELIKAIIPVLHESQKKNWWLNKKNPIYRQLLNKANGKATLIVKIVQTGSAHNTKYAIVE